MKYRLPALISTIIISTFLCKMWGYDFEANDIYYNINADNESVAVTYLSADRYDGQTDNAKAYTGSICIPAQVSYGGKDYPVTEIDQRAFINCSSLVEVKLPESISVIGSHSFYSSGIKAIEIPPLVQVINPGTFAHCSSLKEIKLPESLTELGPYAFSYSGIDSINLPGSIVEIGSACFQECNSLKQIVIPDKVTTLERYTFNKCNSLEVLTCGKSVEIINDDVFSYCPSLLIVNLSPALKEFDCWTLAGCTNLKYICNPSNIDSQNLKLSILGITPGIWEAQRLYLENDFIFVFTNEYTYRLIEYLGPEVETVILPTNINGNNYILGGAFCGNLTLTHINIPNGVTSIDGSFKGCTALSQIVIPNSVTEIGSDAFKGCTALYQIVIPNSVTEIGYYAFKGCTALSQIVIPNSVTKIESEAFSGCTSLMHLEIPGSVKNIIRVIKGCSNLKELVIHITDPSYFGIGYLSDVDALNEFIETTLYVPKGYKSSFFNYYIGHFPQVVYPFRKFKAIQEISVPAESITLSPAELELTIGKSEVLTANVLPENTTEELSWGTSDQSIATVDNSGKVTAVKQGTAIITAKCGNVSATCTITVNEIPAESISISPEGPFTVHKGEKTQLYATILPETATNKSVIWESENNGVVVDENGLVTAISLGECYVIARNSAGQSDKVKFTIVPTMVTGITLDKTSIELRETETYRLSASVTPLDVTDSSLTWGSANPNIATIDADGLVTAISTGQTTISVHANDGSGVSNTCTVTVIPASIVITSDGSTDLKVSQTVQLRAEVMPATASSESIEWSTDNENVATVNDSGLVTATSIGKTVIKASAGNISSEIQITVEQTFAESISINRQSAEVNIGDKLQLTATIMPSTTTDPTIEWSTSDAGIATVDADGIISAISEGIVTITAKTIDGSNLCADCIVKVLPIPVSFVEIVYTGTQKLYVGETVQLSAKVFPENASDRRVSWSVSDDNILHISDDGRVTAIGPGRSYVILRSVSGPVSSSIYFDVAYKPDPLETITLFSDKTFLQCGETVQIHAIIEPSNAIETIIWVSSDEEIVTVTNEGFVTALNKTGQVTVCAIAENGVKGEIKLTVVEKDSEPTELHLNIIETAFHQGMTSEQIEVVTTPPNASPYISWSYTGDAILTLQNNNNGAVTMTAASCGTAILTAKYGDWSEDCKVTVLKPAFNPEIIDFYVNGTKLNNEQTIDANAGIPLHLDVYYLVNVSNKYINNPYFAYSSDIIGLNELSREEYEPFSSGQIVHYMINPIKAGETALYIACGSVGQRIWIDVKENSGINDVLFDSVVNETIYYDLQGNIICTDNIQPGIYIKKTGQRFEKVLIKDGANFQ